ncbi:hypothetical protein [Nonomuraea sp. NPDC050202]|uniref:hypothetical protein n=1 Tax=Nonomuraea sp. NPDC050202 TaxID=3155035 RepID=UPI00340F296D
MLCALSGAKADEREVLPGMLQAAPDVLAAHPEQTIIADRHSYGRLFEAELTERELHLLRPARQGEPERPGAALFKPLRQSIESINQTLKSQLDLERHGGRSAVAHPHGPAPGSGFWWSRFAVPQRRSRPQHPQRGAETVTSGARWLKKFA